MPIPSILEISERNGKLGRRLSETDERTQVSFYLEIDRVLFKRFEIIILFVLIIILRNVSLFKCMWLVQL